MVKVTEEVTLTGPCCVTLAMLPSPSEPLFPHLQREGKNGALCRLAAQRSVLGTLVLRVS